MIEDDEKLPFQIISQTDLMEMLGVKRTTLYKILKANILPVVKIGKNYYTTAKLMEEFFVKMQGHNIFL